MVTAGGFSVNNVASIIRDRVQNQRELRRRFLVEAGSSSVSGAINTSSVAGLAKAALQGKKSMERNSLKGKYLRFAATPFRAIIDHPAFEGFMICVIVLAGALVGAQTYELSSSQHATIDFMNVIILWIFVVEMVAKLIAEGEQPLRYFRDRWNIFDFAIVVAGFLPFGGSQAGVVRLFRLLRVLKLIRILPELLMLVSGLIKSFSGLFYIALLMALTYYLFAIVAVTLFGLNDPVYFGNVFRALLSLWRAATGDDWTDLMYIQIYGCNMRQYGGGEYQRNPSLCTHPDISQSAPFFFAIFVLFGGIVLLNLMVGVIMNSMMEAHQVIPGGDMLRVTVVSGHQLPVADILGSSDPYVALSMGRQRHSTQVVKRELNPVWEEQFLWTHIGHNKVNHLHLEARDWDFCAHDDVLGEVTLNVDALPYFQELSFLLELNTPEGADVDTKNGPGALLVRVLKLRDLNKPRPADEYSRLEKLQLKAIEAQDELQALLDLLKLRRSYFRAMRQRLQAATRVRRLHKLTTSLLPRSLQQRLRDHLRSHHALPQSPVRLTKHQTGALGFLRDDIAVTESAYGGGGSNLVRHASGRRDSGFMRQNSSKRRLLRANSRDRGDSGDVSGLKVAWSPSPDGNGMGTMVVRASIPECEQTDANSGSRRESDVCTPASAITAESTPFDTARTSLPGTVHAGASKTMRRSNSSLAIASASGSGSSDGGPAEGPVPPRSTPSRPKDDGSKRFGDSRHSSAAVVPIGPGVGGSSRSSGDSGTEFPAASTAAHTARSSCVSSPLGHATIQPPPSLGVSVAPTNNPTTPTTPGAFAEEVGSARQGNRSQSAAHYRSLFQRIEDNIESEDCDDLSDVDAQNANPLLSSFRDGGGGGVGIHLRPAK